MQGFLPTLWSALWADESGQDATEYVLLIVMIALVVIAGMQVLATAVNTGFDNAATNLNGSAGGGS